MKLSKEEIINRIDLINHVIDGVNTPNSVDFSCYIIAMLVHNKKVFSRSYSDSLKTLPYIAHFQAILNTYEKEVEWYTKPVMEHLAVLHMGNNSPGNSFDTAIITNGKFPNELRLEYLENVLSDLKSQI